MNVLKFKGKNNPTIFITGASGFVGVHLTKKLVSQDQNVHVLVRNNLQKLMYLRQKIHIHTGDLQDEKKLKTIVKNIKPDIIFHLASCGLYRGMEENENEYFKTNVLGTLNLFNALKHVDFSCCINAGSSSEYGPSQKPMQEEDICNPQSMYAISKLTQTKLAMCTAYKTKKPIITLRLFSPYGPLDDNRRLIPQVFKKALSNEPIKLSNPKAVRDFIYIDDVIDAFVMAMNKIWKTPHIINIGSGKQTTVLQATQTILKATKSKSKINLNSKKNFHYESPVWIADITKAKNLLHWSPKISFEQGIQKILNYE